MLFQPIFCAQSLSLKSDYFFMEIATGIIVVSVPETQSFSIDEKAI